MIARPRFTAHCRPPRSVYTVYTGVKVIEPIPRRSLSPFTAREQITFTLSRVLLLLVDGSMMTSGGAALPPRSCPRSYKYPVIIGGALGVITHQQRRGVREREREGERGISWSQRRQTAVAITFGGALAGEGGGDSSFRGIDDSSIVEGSHLRLLFGRDVVQRSVHECCGGESSRKEASPLNI